MTNQDMTNTFCPECGFGVAVDEEGLCILCGATAVGRAVDQLFHYLADHLPHSGSPGGTI